MQDEGFGVAARRIRPGDEESGLRYARLVTSWSTTADDIGHFIERAAAYLAVEAEASVAAGSAAKL